MNEQFLKSIRVIKSAIAERKLVVFAGAGVSADSGVPLWSELIAGLRNDIEILPAESDLLRIAQLYYNERQQKEFIDRVRELAKYKKLRYNAIHKQIFDLNPEHIVTTNFDDLFEQVIKTKAYPYSVIKKDKEFPYAQNTKLLVKIHGDLDEANIVLKEDDYLEYESNHPLFSSFIKGIFATKVVLFVGYSFSDLNLKIIIQGVKNILGHDFQNAYLLSVEPSFHPSHRQYLKNKGINVINYYDAGKIFDDDFIRQFLFVGRNALNKTIPKIAQKLSEKGERLHHLLRFISVYNEFAEEIEGQDPLTQMLRSLNRFSYVRVLPPKFLSNLYPFNNREDYIHNYYDYTLGSNNKTITNFLFDYVDSDTLLLKESFFVDHKIVFGDRSEMNKKLQVLIRTLNYSTIFYFGRTGNKIDLFDYPKEFSEVIALKLPNRHCDCMSCRFNEFNLSGFLKSINEGSVTETSDLQEDMLLAYSNYKAGNITMAINQFEEIGNKAWQVEEYIIYFISQQNVKILRNLYLWDFEESSQEDREVIREKIEKLDLDKLMFQVPKLSDDVYALLKIIRDDEILVTAERKIDEVYDTIVGVYDFYKRGGTISGPYYPRQIIEELLKTFTFYTYNYIVRDDYSEYKRVFEKGIKALLISFSIDKRYTARFTEFDSWVIRLILLYASDSEIEKVVNQYEINEITIQDEETSVVYRYLSNIFESNYTEDNAFGRIIKLNKEVLKQSTNLFFSQRLRTTIHNALWIYSLIPIPADYADGLIRQFLNFLSVEESLIPGSEKCMNRFLKRLVPFFKFNDFSELLKLGVNKSFMIQSEDFFRIISGELKDKHSDRVIEDTRLMRRIISASIDEGRRIHERGFMHLWTVCDEQNRTLIKEALKLDFAHHFDPAEYYVACFLGIVGPSEYYTELISAISKRIQNTFSLTSEWNFYSDFTILNFLSFIFHKGLIHGEIPFVNFESLPDYMRFYVRPFSFDYSRFDTDWLLPLKRKIYFDHLASIKEIKLALEKRLRLDYNKDFAEIYSRYYV